MKVSNGLLALTLLGGSALAGDQTTGNVTFQVRSEPGYSAIDVQRFLQDAAYLGSVCPGAIPLHQWSGEEVPAEICVVEPAAAGGEILTVRVESGNRATVEKAMSLLIENLDSIEPSGRTQARESLERAKIELATAEQAHEQVKRALSQFVNENGAVNPSQWLNVIRNNLLERTSQLESADMQLAGSRALRDYLARAADGEPEVIVEKINENDAHIVQYRQALSAAEDVLAQLRERYQDGHAKIKEAEIKIRDIRVALENRKNQTSSFTNPRRRELEKELFKIERELVLDEHRRQFLVENVAELRAEAKRYARMESEYRELDRAFNESEQRLRLARKMHSDSLFQSDRLLAGEWIRVIAGPQMEVRPSGN